MPVHRVQTNQPTKPALDRLMEGKHLVKTTDSTSDSEGLCRQGVYSEEIPLQAFSLMFCPGHLPLAIVWDKMDSSL